MVSISKVYFEEIEDRLDSRFYQESYLEPIRKLKKKGIPIINLGEVIKPTNGVEIRQYTKSGTPYIRVSDMKSFLVNLNSVKYVNSQVPDKVKLKKGDVLVSRSGNPGVTSLVSEEIINSIISSHVIRIEIKDKERLDPNYLVLYLNTWLGKSQIDRITNGCLVMEINHPSLGLVKVPIISKTDQIKIKKILEQAQKKNTDAIKKIEEAKKIFIKELGIKEGKIKEDKFYKVFSNELNDILTPRYYYPLYINTIKEIEKKFKIVKLHEIAEITRGDEPGSESYKNFVSKEDSDVPFIRTSDLVNYEIDNYPDFYLPKKTSNLLNQDLKEEDILFTKDGKIGLSAIFTQADSCLIASGLAKIRLKKYSPYYIFIVLNTFCGLYQAKQNIVIAATLPHLNPERLGEMKIPLIAEEKQKEISKLVRDAYILKSEKKRLIKGAIEKVEKLIKV